MRVKWTILTHPRFHRSHYDLLAFCFGGLRGHLGVTLRFVGFLALADLGGIEAACLSSCAGGTVGVVAGSVYLRMHMDLHVTLAGYILYTCII